MARVKQLHPQWMVFVMLYIMIFSASAQPGSDQQGREPQGQAGVAPGANDTMPMVQRQDITGGLGRKGGPQDQSVPGMQNITAGGLGRMGPMNATDDGMGPMGPINATDDGMGRGGHRGGMPRDDQNQGEWELGPHGRGGRGDRGEGPRMRLQDRSSGFKMLLNASDPDSYLQIQFGRVAEVDSQGRMILGHMIDDLDMLNATVVQGTTIINGTNVTYAKITIPLATALSSNSTGRSMMESPHGGRDGRGGRGGPDHGEDSFPAGPCRPGYFNDTLGTLGPNGTALPCPALPLNATDGAIPPPCNASSPFPCPVALLNGTLPNGTILPPCPLNATFNGSMPQHPPACWPLPPLNLTLGMPPPNDSDTTASAFRQARHGCIRAINSTLTNDTLPCPMDELPSWNGSLPNSFNDTFGPGGPFNGTIMGPGMNRAPPQVVACPTELNATTLKGSIVITTFVLAANTSFPFGFNNTLQAPANSFKFNIETYDWPFCSSNNSLAIDVFIRTNNATEPKALLDRTQGPPQDTLSDPHASGIMRARLEYPPGQVTAMELPPYATDGPDGNQTFPVGIQPAGMPGQTGFTFVFPAGKAIYYDPVVAADTSITAAQLGVASSDTTTNGTVSSSVKAKNSAGRATGGLALLVPALLVAVGMMGIW